MVPIQRPDVCLSDLPRWLHRKSSASREPHEWPGLCYVLPGRDYNNHNNSDHYDDHHDRHHHYNFDYHWNQHLDDQHDLCYQHVDHHKQQQLNIHCLALVQVSLRRTNPPPGVSTLQEQFQSIRGLPRSW